MFFKRHKKSDDFYNLHSVLLLIVLRCIKIVRGRQTRVSLQPRGPRNLIFYVSSSLTELKSSGLLLTLSRRVNSWLRAGVSWTGRLIAEVAWKLIDRHIMCDPRVK